MLDETPTFRSILNVGQCRLGNYKSHFNFSQASPCGPYWWRQHVTIVCPLLLNSFAVSCPCVDPTLATHWIQILFICIKLALCCPIGCSEQVTSQRTSWFLLSSSWCPCCAHISSPFCLLINVNRLHVAWETCGLCLNSIRERPDCLCPIFMISWLPALQLGSTSWLLSWNFVNWGELMNLYI